LTALGQRINCILRHLFKLIPGMGSWVWVLAGRHGIVALGKLLTPVCLCHRAV